MISFKNKSNKKIEYLDFDFELKFDHVVFLWHSLHSIAKVKLTYILIAHVPIRTLSKWHHLPHRNAIAPHITRRGEFPEGDGLRGSPADWDFPPLYNTQTPLNPNTNFRSTDGAFSSLIRVKPQP